MNDYVYSFNNYLKEKFGQKVHRLSLDAGFSCPNIDGKLSRQGCVFCNNKAFSNFVRRPVKNLEEQIIQAKDSVRRRFKAKKYIAYFQSFSNTYADIECLRKQYSVVRKFDDIVGIAISTRPDCINQETLNLIGEFTKDYQVYIEYGLQTIHDKTLEAINRKHSFSDFKKAVDLTSQCNNIHIAVHVILGLPGETRPDMLATANALAKLPLWGVKFHALHVVRDTLLEQIYKQGKLELLALDEYAEILVSFLELLPKNYVVLRLASDADKNFLIAPVWVNDKARVLKRIEQEFSRRRTHQGALYENTRYSCA